MIRKVKIENFMSLKKVEIDLEPLTLFIGKNSTGKSAIFKALVVLSKLLGGMPLRGREGEFNLEDGVTLDDLVWSGNSGIPIRFSIWLDDDSSQIDPSYFLELSKKAEGWSVTHEVLKLDGGLLEFDENHPFDHPTERGPKSWVIPARATLRYLVHPFANDSRSRPIIEPIIKFAEEIGQTWRYRPSAIDIARFVRIPVPAKGSKERKFIVRENGSGTAFALQSLQGEKRETFTKIEDDLKGLFSHIRTIGFKTDWQGVRLTFMTDRSEDPIPAPQESDGVLLAVFLLWRLYTADSRICVCLEEPEGGLHPDLLGARFELLKQFAYPTSDIKVPQILVATHSYELMRLMKSHHSTFFEQTRVVEFDQNEGTTVEKLKNWRDVGKLLERLG